MLSHTKMLFCLLGIRSPAKAAGGQAGVTCGACKNKGHSRTSKQCSLYYSDGETARREVGQGAT